MNFSNLGAYTIMTCPLKKVNGDFSYQMDRGILKLSPDMVRRRIFRLPPTTTKVIRWRWAVVRFPARSF